MTTRDEPDYGKLMRMRIDVLKGHGLGLRDVLDVIASMDLLPGAREFMDWLRTKGTLIVVSASPS